MGVFRWILTILLILVAIVMTVVILMQEGKSQGLGALSGSSADTYWGKNKGRSFEGFLERFTIGLVCAFFVLAVLLNMNLF